MAPHRLARAARDAAIVATSLLALGGLLAGAVRVLPWLLDPDVPWRVAQPFARGLAAVAVEAALIVGWPVGWALASLRFVERGEARVLETLGRSPEQTACRLAPHGALFAAALALMALAYGRDASAPGRVASELIARARAACQTARGPATYAIPFTDLTWLCAPGVEPRLVGRGPGALSGAVLTARDARIAGDFRAIDLYDARVLLPSADGSPPALVRTRSLAVHGMAPWASASTLPAALRALVLVATAWSASVLSAYLVLSRVARTRLGALVLGAAGPLAALAAMRLLERAGAPLWTLLAVPSAGAAATCLAALASLRLRGRGSAANT